MLGEGRFVDGVQMDRDLFDVKADDVIISGLEGFLDEIGKELNDLILGSLEGRVQAWEKSLEDRNKKLVLSASQVLEEGDREEETPHEAAFITDGLRLYEYRVVPQCCILYYQKPPEALSRPSPSSTTHNPRS